MSHRLYLYNKAEIGSSEDDCLPLMEWGYELPLLLHPLFAQGACVGHNCYNDPHSEEGLYAEAPAGIEALRAFYAFIERHAGSLLDDVEAFRSRWPINTVERLAFELFHPLRDAHGG